MSAWPTAVPKLKVLSINGSTAAVDGTTKPVFGYSALSEAMQARISGKTLAAALALVRSASDGGVAAGIVEAPPAAAGRVTLPRVLLVAIRVTVAMAPCASAGATRIWSSTASMPVPLATKAPVSGLVLLVLIGLIMATTAATAASSRCWVAAVASAAVQAAETVLATGAQTVARAVPPGWPDAVATIRSVSGVMLTVCPAAVAMELSVTCLPPDVPVMLRKNGAVMPATSTVKAPPAPVLTATDTLPLLSMATTLPATGAPTAAVPLSVVATGTTGGAGGVGSAGLLLPPPQAASMKVAAQAAASGNNWCRFFVMTSPWYFFWNYCQ